MMNYIVKMNLTAASKKENKGNQQRRVSSARVSTSHGPQVGGETSIYHKAEMMFIGGETIASLHAGF